MQVLLRNPMDEFVIPFVQELCRRLPLRGSDSSLSHDECWNIERVGKKLKKQLYNFALEMAIRSQVWQLNYIEVGLVFFLFLPFSVADEAS